MVQGLGTWEGKLTHYEVLSMPEAILSSLLRYALRVERVSRATVLITLTCSSLEMAGLIRAYSFLDRGHQRVMSYSRYISSLRKQIPTIQYRTVLDSWSKNLEVP